MSWRPKIGEVVEVGRHRAKARVVWLGHGKRPRVGVHLLAGGMKYLFLNEVQRAMRVH